MGIARYDIFPLVAETRGSLRPHWEKKTDMPVIKHRYATSVVDGKISVIPENRSVYAYDPVADVWEQKSDMPRVREGFSTSVVNGVIYVISWDTDCRMIRSLGNGKPNGWQRSWEDKALLLALEAYNPLTEWERRADMPVPEPTFPPTW